MLPERAGATRGDETLTVTSALSFPSSSPEEGRCGLLAGSATGAVIDSPPPVDPSPETAAAQIRPSAPAVIEEISLLEES